MSKGRWERLNAEILARLDIKAEYQKLGLEITGREPNRKGWIKARALGREDRHPSAEINVGHGPGRGKYWDWVTSERYGLWDFAAKFGGFADWKEARKHYAELAGVEMPRGRPPTSNEQIQWQEWNATLAAAWCAKKPGVTPEAIRRCGGRLGKWPLKSGKYPIVALPIYGPELAEGEPQGWVMWHRGGQQLPVSQGKGNPPKWVKMKTLAGSKSGWMGAEGLHRLDEAEIVWKTEGPGDMMALLSILPKSAPVVVIANSGGAGEIPNPDLLEHLAGKTVYVLHDADRPGQGVHGDNDNPERVFGARLWSREIARFAKECRNVRLPYQIEENHGKDVRDFINEGHGYEDLLELAEAAEIVPPPPGEQEPRRRSPAAEEAEEEAPEKVRFASVAPSSETVMDLHICEEAQLDVLGELEDRSILLWSVYHRKIRRLTASDLARLSVAGLFQIAGPAARKILNRGSEPLPNTFTLDQIKDAIGMLAGHRQLPEDFSLAGAGIWPGQDYEGEQTDSLILVGEGEAARLNGEPKMQRVMTPRVDGRLLDFRSNGKWYDFDGLNARIAKAQDAEWRGKVVMDLAAVFRLWSWRHQEQSPMLAAGLVLATWVQTVWRWRPCVSVAGASNTGKSILFQTLRTMFGNLALDAEDVTEASLRQDIGGRACAIFLDEFEDSSHRKKILELFRATSRGGRVTRWGQKAFTIRHIPWVAAIEIGLKRAPDLNRFIQFELTRPPAEEFGKLTESLPRASELAQLGQDMLAVALTTVRAAQSRYEALHAHKVRGIDPRVVENYAVPAAMLAAAYGLNDEQATVLLTELLAPITELDQTEGDELDLLTTVLGSSVDMDRGDKSTVGRLLSQVYVSSAQEEAAREHLGRYGVAKIKKRKPDGGFERCLFLAPKIVTRMLLKGTDWARQDIGSILERLPGAGKCQQRVGGTRFRGVAIPWNQIADHLGDDEAEDDSAEDEF